jgi:hypothetical protein
MTHTIWVHCHFSLQFRTANSTRQVLSYLINRLGMRLHIVTYMLILEWNLEVFQ